MFVVDAESLSLYSESFKDAYGYRPHGEMLEFNSLEDFRAASERVNADVSISIQNERMGEEAAWERFLAELDTLVAVGAGNRSNALRWVIQGDEMFQDLGFLCYEHGLSYSKEAELRAMREAV